MLGASEPVMLVQNSHQYAIRMSEVFFLITKLIRGFPV